MKEFKGQLRLLYNSEYKGRSISGERLSQIREANIDPLVLALDRKRITRDLKNPY